MDRAVAAIPFWDGLRHIPIIFHQGAEGRAGGSVALWRVSVPRRRAAIAGRATIEAGDLGCTSASAAKVSEVASRAGGHATLFMAAHKHGGAFAPLRPPLDRIHRDLKKAFDPDGVFNRGRLYPGL